LTKSQRESLARCCIFKPSKASYPPPYIRAVLRESRCAVRREDEETEGFCSLDGDNDVNMPLSAKYFIVCISLFST